MSGSGTLIDPWTFEEAINSRYTTFIKPGDTLYLRGGTYSGDFTSVIQGEPGNPITIRAYNPPGLPREQVIIDGSITNTGDYVRWQDLIMTYSGWTAREFDEVQATKAGFYNDQAVGTELINNVIHDTVYAIKGTNTPGCLVYGNIMMNSGYKQTLPRPAGHLVYTGNLSEIPSVYKHNILCGGFFVGFHCYSDRVDELNDLHFIENTMLETGVLYAEDDFSPALLVGGYGVGVQAVRPKVIGNRVWFNTKTKSHWSIDVGYEGGAVSPEVKDNFIVGKYPLRINSEDPDASGNIEHTFDNLPTDGQDVFLDANQHDSDKANLTIYNWSLADNIVVDVSAVYDIGDTLAVHNVQDYFLDVQELAVAGDGTITVNMQAVNRTVAMPIQWSAPATVFPNFGCFRLVRQ